jgi:scavenger receptor class B, member 1
MDIYLFNWTNPDEIKNKSSKPNFHELGPYRFREFPDKMNVTFNDNNATVSYRKFSHFFFDPEGSNGSLSDLCTTVNMVAIGAGKRVPNSGFIERIAITSLLSSHKQKLHVTKPVQELLFDGYQDGMVKIANKFVDTPYDRVGFMVKRNGTEMPSGVYNVQTGTDSIFNLGTIQNHNYMPEFPYYEGECKKLKGSAGEFFHPEPSIQQPINLFAPEMCRAIPYDFEKNVEVEGVFAHRFLAGSKALDNGTNYSENKCYATDEFMPSGVMNVSICNYNQPMFMSFPHFYGADSYYVDAVEGMKPEKELHETFITLEPVKVFFNFNL